MILMLVMMMMMMMDDVVDVVDDDVDDDVDEIDVGSVLPILLCEITTRRLGTTLRLPPLLLARLPCFPCSPALPCPFFRLFPGGATSSTSCSSTSPALYLPLI